MRDHLSIIGIQRWQLRSKPAKSISPDSQHVYGEGIGELESSLEGSLGELVTTVGRVNLDGTHRKEGVSKLGNAERRHNSSSIVGESEHKLQAAAEDLSVVNAQSSIVNVVEVGSSRSDPAKISAYAAHSCRVNDKAEQQHWLWVVPQARFASQELQLLDKIVTATESEWKNTSVADNYCSGLELSAILEKKVDAIVVFGMTEQECQSRWPELIAHPIYRQKRCYLAASLQELLTDSGKKRIVWQNLQSFMRF